MRSKPPHTNIPYSHPPLGIWNVRPNEMTTMKRRKKTISILIICSKNCLFIKIKCNFRVNNGKTWKSMQSISDFIMMITGANVRTQHLTPISNHMSKIIIFDFRCHLQCCAVRVGVFCSVRYIAFVRFASLAKAPTQWRFTHNNGNKIRKWICVSHLVAPQH